MAHANQVSIRIRDVYRLDGANWTLYAFHVADEKEPEGFLVSKGVSKPFPLSAIVKMQLIQRGQGAEIWNSDSKWWAA